MSKNYDGLDEALGIDHDVQLPQVQVMGPEESKAVVQAEDDSEYARRNIREIIEKSRETLETALDTASSSGLDKQITAASSLITALVNANEKLVGLAKQASATKNGEGPSKVVNNTQNVMIVGTTDDLLKAVRKARGEHDNEDSLER